MSAQQRSYKIRLSAEGARQLESEMRRIGISGRHSFAMISDATKPATKGLRAVNKASNSFRVQLQGIGREIPAVQRLSRFLGTTALAGGLIAFGKSSLDVAATFEASMKRVEAATGAPESAMVRLDEKARALGAFTAFTASQAADAMEVLAKNGLAVETILGGALDATLGLAGGLGGDLAPAADLVTDLMLQFGLETDQLVNIADRVTGAALKSKFGFDDLRGAIGQAGGVAGSFGVDIDDFLTSLAATAPAFSSGRDAGTGFKTFLQRLTPESAKAEAAMAKLGLEFFDTQGNMRSMAEVAGELKEGIANLTEEDRNQALKTIFGTDAIRTALLLAKEGTEGFLELKEAVQSVSAAEQAQVRLEGLEGALRELTSAWEALQLHAANNGGLEAAEQLTDLLTANIRRLTENFEEVKEVAERVAHALVVYLVGRGMTLALAKAVALRASYIDLAMSMKGVSVAAGTTATSLTRAGIAGRAFLGVLGGPLSLALTAATLLSLGVNTDATADAIGRAEIASDNASDALDAYRDASRKAKEEQEGLGGAVSETTKQLVTQTRLQLENALTEYEQSFEDLQGRLEARAFKKQGTLATIGFIEREISGQGGNSYLETVVAQLRDLRQGTANAAALNDEIERFAAAGQTAAEIAQDFDEEAQLSGEAAKKMVAYAESLGIFGKELRDVMGASTDYDRAKSLLALRNALVEASDASGVLRDSQLDLFLGLLEETARAETAIANTREQLRNVTVDLSRDPDNPTVLQRIEEEAGSAADAVKRLDEVYGNFLMAAKDGLLPTDRGQWLRDAEKTASKGMRDLIGYAEGTDKGRKYNETLGYGKFTDGPVNLINMTLREVLELQKQMLAHPDNGYNSSAVGRYQIVGTTLGGKGFDGAGGLMASLGLSLEDQFAPALQDRLADELIRQRASQGVTGLRQEWQGLNNVGADTITTAMGAKVLPTMDSKLAEAQARAERDRTKALEEQSTAISALIETGNTRVAQLEFEQSLVGKSVSDAARLRFVFEALAQAKREGIDVDQTLIATGETLRQQILRQADAVAALAGKEDQRRGGKASDEDIVDSLKSNLERLEESGASVKDVMADMADSIRGHLLDLALDPLWEWIASSIAGLLGFSGGGPIQSAATGSIPTKATGGLINGYADGGDVQYGGRATGKLSGRGGKTEDNILFWGSRGEFMQPAAAVDFYGQDFMEAVRTRRLPRLPGFKSGGALSDPQALNRVNDQIGQSKHAQIGKTMPSELHMSVDLSDEVDVRIQKVAGPVALQTSTALQRQSDRSLAARNHSISLRGTA